MAPLQDRLIVGTRVIIANEADLRGQISIGSGTVIHPKATILALQGPISIGSDCIIEELAVIVNRTGQAVTIGDANLFEVGCRVEAFAIGSNNVFEARCKIASSIGVADFCTIGAGCSVYPPPISSDELEDLFAENDSVETAWIEQQEEPANVAQELLPDRTIVYGSNNQRRAWSGEGVKQTAALHAKHLEYLREAIPAANKLKLIQGVRAAPSTNTK